MGQRGRLIAGAGGVQVWVFAAGGWLRHGGRLIGLIARRARGPKRRADAGGAIICLQLARVIVGGLVARRLRIARPVGWAIARRGGWRRLNRGHITGLGRLAEPVGLPPTQVARSSGALGRRRAWPRRRPTIGASGVSPIWLTLLLALLLILLLAHPDSWLSPARALGTRSVGLFFQIVEIRRVVASAAWRGAIRTAPERRSRGQATQRLFQREHIANRARPTTARLRFGASGVGRGIAVVVRWVSHARLSLSKPNPHRVR